MCLFEQLRNNEVIINSAPIRDNCTVGEFSMAVYAQKTSIIYQQNYRVIPAQIVTNSIGTITKYHPHPTSLILTWIFRKQNKKIWKNTRETKWHFAPPNIMLQNNRRATLYNSNYTHKHRENAISNWNVPHLCPIYLLSTCLFYKTCRSYQLPKT